MPYTILCSPQQRAGAQHRVFGFPGEQLVPVALCCWQESVESLRGEGDEFSFWKLSFRIVDGLNGLKIMTLERSWCRCLAVGDETGSGVMGDVERLPPLGALPLTGHLFPIPLQITCSLSGPQNTVFFLWVMFGGSPSFPWCALLLPVPALPNPGSARAEQGRAFPGHSDAHQRAQTWCKHPSSHPTLL